MWLDFFATRIEKHKLMPIGIDNEHFKTLINNLSHCFYLQPNFSFMKLSLILILETQYIVIDWDCGHLVDNPVYKGWKKFLLYSTINQ